MSTDGPLGAVEKLIRDAIEQGEFDRLPGAGKPIPDLDREYDPGWWAKRYVEKMKIEDAIVDVRAQIDRELPRLKVMPDREAALKRVEELNQLVAEVNEKAGNEPLTPIVLDG